MPRLILALALPAAVALAVGLTLSRTPAAADAAPAVSPPGLRYMGTASCSAAACHHGNGPRGEWRSEYTTWAGHDPHARAHEVLFNDQSQTIARNLGTGPSQKNALCLNCHVLPGVAPLGSAKEVPRHERFTVEDGVGCESCHGPAEKWLARHYRKEWQSLTPAEKAVEGMWDTKDLVMRAELCARCHVGGGDLDVNHDLIAAGHPRLSFELAAYHAVLPKHWSEKKDREGRPNFDARLWLIGQVVSAHAALDLLHDRAAGRGKPWPEFAEYDCFACHHDLSDQKWRREPARVKGRLGMPAWGTWYFALHDVVAKHPPAAGVEYPETSFKDLQKLMSGLHADRRQVEDKAAGAAATLAGWLPKLRSAGPAWPLAELARDLDGKAEKELNGSVWDEAAQLYLALAAQGPDARRKEFLQRLRKDLQFPAPYDSPHDFDPQRLGGKPPVGGR
jgi:hypothetical protein